jgi:hypothetical protein
LSLHGAAAPEGRQERVLLPLQLGVVCRQPLVVRLGHITAVALLAVDTTSKRAPWRRHETVVLTTSLLLRSGRSPSQQVTLTTAAALA